jgi:hypothetical protein
MGIVMFVLVSTANTSLQLWRGTSEKMAVDREGRSGLALLAWDLQNIVQPTNLALRPWINTNIFNSGTANAPVLRFLTLKPADYQDPATDFGDVCYVEYRFTNYSLIRAFVGSRDTFTSLQGGSFPNPAQNRFETLATNIWICKFWGLQDSAAMVGYNAGSGQQSVTNQNLRSVEYRLGILDQKFMKLYRNNSALAAAQETNGIRWYQGIQPVPPPVP